MGKPKGIHANFAVDCPRCDGELTVTSGRIDPHTCDFRVRNLEAIQEQIDNPLSFADINSALDAK